MISLHSILHMTANLKLYIEIHCILSKVDLGFLFQNIISTDFCMHEMVYKVEIQFFMYPSV